MNIQLIQVNVFLNYGIDRVNQLISELNVHYNALKNYHENKLGVSDFAKKEIIDAYAKLYELSELLKFDKNKQSTVSLLESTIALLKLTENGQPVRNKLKGLGKQIAQKLYDAPLNTLIEESLRYKWLRKHNLVLASMDSQERLISSHWMSNLESNSELPELPPHFKFEPDDSALEEYFESNKTYILHYLVNQLQENTVMQDPMRKSGASDMYHYTVYLEQF
jgi:hypothetical protein